METKLKLKTIPLEMTIVMRGLKIMETSSSSSSVEDSSCVRVNGEKTGRKWVSERERRKEINEDDISENEFLSKK